MWDKIKNLLPKQQILKPIPEIDFKNNNNKALQSFYSRDFLKSQPTKSQPYIPKTVKIPQSLANAGKPNPTLFKQLSEKAFGKPMPKQVKGVATKIITREPLKVPTPVPKTSWENFSNMVIREANARGYSGETVARQKALESAFGESNFAKQRNNYGGIGAYDANPNNAYSYKSPEDYLTHYFSLIEKDPRYKEAYKNRANPRKYLEGLKKGGYASDPNYVENILNTPLRRK